MTSPREIRIAAKKTQLHIAAEAGTSIPLVRLYEANPGAVKNRDKKAALDALYARLASPSRNPHSPEAAPAAA